MGKRNVSSAMTWVGAAAVVVALAVTGLRTPAAPATPVASKHRVVVEVTTSGEQAWGHALRNVENLRTAFGVEDVQIEVVAHGEGIGLLVTRQPKLLAQMQRLSEAKVVFAACQNTMKAKHIAPKELPAFATPVDSGVAAVVRKQEAGWSYLKAGD